MSIVSKSSVNSSCNISDIVFHDTQYLFTTRIINNDAYWSDVDDVSFFIESNDSIETE